MNVLLAPDVYVNASVALGSPPEQVVQRVLGKQKNRSKATEWVLARVKHMLSALPEFKHDAVDQQLKLIRSLVDIVEDTSQFAPGEWEGALVAAAKKAGVKRVITDHPDLLEKEQSGGVEFVSSEAFLIELTTPPPAPV
jgi:glycerophosphoryl diester phosphodiesterase